MANANGLPAINVYKSEETKAKKTLTLIYQFLVAIKAFPCQLARLHILEFFVAFSAPPLSVSYKEGEFRFHLYRGFPQNYHHPTWLHRQSWDIIVQNVDGLRPWRSCERIGYLTSSPHRGVPPTHLTFTRLCVTLSVHSSSFCDRSLIVMPLFHHGLLCGPPLLPPCCRRRRHPHQV